MQENQIVSELLKKERYSFEDLKTITAFLRSENGCPWDREQDHHSIRPNLIEETYEVVEAIDTENSELLREELGDLLFQITFHAQLEREAGSFDVDDVVDEICKKMVTRHPHVFGDVTAETSAQVLKNWDAIKTEEKQRRTLEDKLRAIPPMMPSLMRAVKVCNKAGCAQEGTLTESLNAIATDLSDLEKSLNSADAKTFVGRLLLDTARLCARLGVDAEHALQNEIEDLINKIAQNQ